MRSHLKRGLHSVAAFAMAALALGTMGPGAFASAASTPTPARLITRVPTTQKLVALTFDDGPTQKWTPQILDALKANHVPATFFVIGIQVQKYPNFVTQEKKDGMEIANHGYQHMIMRNKSAAQIEGEVQQNAQLLEGLGVPKPNLYRLPAGISDRTALDVLGKLGYTVIGWSVDPRDWRHKYTAQQMAAIVEKQVQPGAIIIFHDGTNSSTQTVEAVKTIIPALKAQGYRFVTVGTLVQLVRQQLRPRL